MYIHRDYDELMRVWLRICGRMDTAADTRLSPRQVAAALDRLDVEYATRDDGRVRLGAFAPSL